VIDPEGDGATAIVHDLSHVERMSRATRQAWQDKELLAGAAR
jgi:hypothetical protein